MKRLALRCLADGRGDRLRLLIALLLAWPVFQPLAATAQGAPASFQITKITPKLLTTPKFPYLGAEQRHTDPADRWLEVEAEFSAGPAFTEELTIAYIILLNGKVVTGEVTHAGILAGARRSVMYVSPKGLRACLNNAPITMNAVQNIAVQAVFKGSAVSELSLKNGAAQWYAAMPRLSGLVLNKNETPFAPIYWDRYEQIKAFTR